ncbi:MAG: hypothetical protein FJ077_04200 [Cyanobacteria bacterium K_DeepCast_35m_m2_023]|nr:hypothetical protein [Cyanobacteria bacterium K_DeepCast_35m_m2_023]
MGQQLANRQATSQGVPKAPRRRGKRQCRPLFCPLHPQQLISGQGKKYFLHCLKAEELVARGTSHKTARLLIQHYPVLVLSNEWLEQLYCPKCGSSDWFHIAKLADDRFVVRRAPLELWQQVAHVAPLSPNPSVSDFSRRMSRRTSLKRSDGQRFFDG